MKLTYQKVALLSKLHDELLAAGIPLDNGGASPVQGKENEVYIYVADDTSQTVIDQITAIINAHNPTPPPQPPTQEERLAAVEQALIELMMEGGM